MKTKVRKKRKVSKKVEVSIFGKDDYVLYLKQPAIVLGVERNDLGEVTHYHLRYKSTPTSTKTTARFVTRKEIVADPLKSYDQK